MPAFGQKILFWGTPEFALPSLKRLITQGFDVASVVTNPDEPVGRRQIITPPPVKVFAQKHCIPVLQPEKIGTDDFKHMLPKADVFVVAAYGKLIPKSILEIPRLSSLNIHPSLLPYWRGPSPIQYTILHGDLEAGVTIIKIDELMDHGPILAQQKLQVTSDQLQKITYLGLHEKLAELGADLLVEVLPKWFRGEISCRPQDDFKATFSKILKKEDGRINWSRSGEEIERMVRAFNPWPSSWTLWPIDSKIFRIRIEESDWTGQESILGSPGFVWQNTTHHLLVKTGKGSLVIKRLTLEGKRSMDAEDFSKKFPKLIGTTFI